jgi:hypothetical protein
MSTQVLSCEGLCQFTPACAGSVCANSECVGLFWQPNGQGLCAAGSSAYCDPTTFEPVKCLELL